MTEDAIEISMFSRVEGNGGKFRHNTVAIASSVKFSKSALAPGNPLGSGGAGKLLILQ